MSENNPQANTGFYHLLHRAWMKIPESARLNLNDTFQPEDIDSRLIPGEERQLEIRLAWYRNISGTIVFHHTKKLVAIAIVTAVIIAAVVTFAGGQFLYALIPFAILIGLGIWGLVERFTYLQWRLLKTNARLVISVPQRGAWPLVDNIELKGAPAIIDINWSPNPVWRIFQFFTGARDLYLSMSGLQFAEGKAKVRDALIIPDIMPDDVYELKKLVFKPQ